MKILVIDDTPINQESALATLQGHEVVVARCFKETSLLLNTLFPERVDFDAVLTDVHMPAYIEPRSEQPDLNAIKPFGLEIALKALLCPKVKYVGVFTNAGGHGEDHFTYMAGEIANHQVRIIGDKRIYTAAETPESRGIYAPGLFLENGAKDWSILLKILVEGQLNDNMVSNKVLRAIRKAKLAHSAVPAES